MIYNYILNYDSSLKKSGTSQSGAWVLDPTENTNRYVQVHPNLLSTPMGVDYVVIGFNMELQPLVTHNAA